MDNHDMPAASARSFLAAKFRPALVFVPLLMLLMSSTVWAVAQDVDPMPTLEAPSKKAQSDETDFQQRLTQLNIALLEVEAQFAQMAKRVTPPDSSEFDGWDEKLLALNREANDLSIMPASSLAKIQLSAEQDRLKVLKQMLDVVRQRSQPENSVFGLAFFNANPPSSQDSDVKPSAANYTLRPKDKIKLFWFGSLGGQRTYDLVIDDEGKIVVPAIGKAVASGKTVAELKNVLNTRIRAQFKQITVDVSLETPSSISVRVAGEVSRPGTYTLSGAATVFSALYKAGGPTKLGTFRHISLTRGSTFKRNIDLYKFLIDGVTSNDIPLRDGDTIFVPTVGKTIMISGEVIRPGRYEPNFPLTLAAALQLAGGAKPASYLHSVSITRVVNGEYQVILNASSKGLSELSKTSLQPGDQVVVAEIQEDKTNRVSVEGPVNVPGIFGYSDGMKVSDLVKLARGLAQDKEVYGARADLLRIDPYKGTEIITFNLEKALAGDASQNIAMHKLDRLFIYEPQQVVFQPRLVTVSGAIARPGVYKRSLGMKIADVVAVGGGVLPESYLARAELTRRKPGANSELIRVNLQAALNGDPDANLSLEDRDELMVYTLDEVSLVNQRVNIQGAVQRPGSYIRKENMNVSDLIFAAGGLLPDASSVAELARSKDGNIVATNINLESLANSPQDDVLLIDRDTLNIPSMNKFAQASFTVTVSGEVARPGPYALTSNNMRISDIISKSGGLTDMANPAAIVLIRQKESFDNVQQSSEVTSILRKMQELSDKDFLVQLSKMGMSIPPEYQSKLIAHEEVANADDLNIKDKNSIIKASSSVGANDIDAAKKVDYAGVKISSNLVRISIDSRKALSDTNSPHNLQLLEGDRVMVPKLSNVVTVIGDVMNPGVYVCEPGNNWKFYLGKAGGPLPDAAIKYAVVIHPNCETFSIRDVKTINPGDTIVIPTMKLVEMSSKVQKVGSVAKVVSDVLSSVFILTKF